MSSVKLKACLEEIGLGTLLQNFVNEKIDDETFSFLSEFDLSRIDISTIRNRVRLREKMQRHVATTDVPTTSSGLTMFGGMDRIPQDYLGGDLSTKATSELKELLSRQEKLLKRNFLKSLPDEGKKVRDFVEKLRKLIHERSNCALQKQIVSQVQKDKNSQTIDDTVSSDSDSCKRKDKPLSRFKKQGIDSGNIESSHERNKKFGSLVEEEAKLVNSNSFSEKMDIDSKVENSSGGVVGRDRIALSDLETALENIDIGSQEQTDNYIINFIERTNCNKKREPLKLNRDLKISDVKDLPIKFKPPIDSTKMSTGTKKSSLTEESAVCPPKYKYGVAKEMPLSESMQLQEQQSKRREEYQALYAAERLAEKLNVKMDTFNPEGNNVNYRDPKTIDSDDDLEGVD